MQSKETAAIWTFFNSFDIERYHSARDETVVRNVIRQRHSSARQYQFGQDKTTTEQNPSTSLRQ